MVFSPKKLLAFMPGSFLAVLSAVEIEREDQHRLVLNADGWIVGFDKPSQVVTYSGKPVASFSTVEAVGVQHFVNGKRFEWWVLSLKLRGGKKLSIGRSTDGAQISIAAAHAASVMEKSVLATQGVGL
jgi:hypothetical protein